MNEFEQFWIAYPRKTAKVRARHAFAKAIQKTTLKAMLHALEWQCQSEQWLNMIIPHPATWLNQERWDDEPPQAPRFSTKTAKNVKAIFGDGDF